jgi:hypothetical protein
MSKKFEYRWIGVITPSYPNMSLRGPMTLDMVHEESGFSGPFSISVTDNAVTASITLDNEAENIGTLRNIIEGAASFVTDCVNLDLAAGFEVRMTSVHDVANDKKMTLQPGVPEVATKWGDGELSIKEMWDLCWNSHPLQRALSEYTNALRHPGQTGFHCGAILEALAHHFGPMTSNTEIRASRATCCTALKIPSEIDRLFIRASASPRHGGGPFVSGEERVALLAESKKMIKAFAAYLNTANAAAGTRIKP